MNIKSALKYKNKLTSNIQKELGKVTAYNSVDEGSNKPYSAKDAWKKYVELTNELITLKTTIHKANGPVYDKIFRLSELKSLVTNLKRFDCSEGMVSTGRWGAEPQSKVKVAEMTITERDGLVEFYEAEIEQIQDKLDHFNQVTEI
jgi:hypothetical protein